MSQTPDNQLHKKREKKIHTYYEIEGGKLISKLKKCPRCGSFMANHKEKRPRWTCGTCSYTEYKKNIHTK